MNTQLILRRINLSTTIIIIALCIASLFLIFYKPVANKSVVKQKNQALEELRQAQMNLVTAKLDSIRYSQEQINDLSLKKDAELTRRLDENTKALNKTHDEKPRDFTNYSSQQLQREVSDLVRQYKTVKQ